MLQNRSNHSLIKWTRLWLCLAIILTPVTLSAYATKGLPDSPKFGYGIRVDPWGQDVSYALNTAASSNLDWIGIDLNWEQQWPERNDTLNLSKLDKVMSYASDNGLSVLLSITNPPGWAKTDRGPDIQITTGLVAQLLRLYPESLLAVELFPAANTKSGWGAAPDPHRYAELLHAVSTSLKSTGRNTVLVAAGLEPLNGSGTPQDINDLAYLEQLYAAGAAQYMPVVGLRFPTLIGDPLSAPWETETQVLRRYELIRKVMLANSHTKGMIWVTGFTWPAQQVTSQPTSNLGSASSPVSLDDERARWFNQAYQMMRSQLYIGAAFFDCSNPPVLKDSSQTSQQCLIQINDGKPSIHPAFTLLSQMIALENNHQKQLSDPQLEDKLIPFDPKTFLKLSSP